MDIPPMHEKQRRLLAALDRIDEPADTSQLREQTGIESGRVSYHLRELKTEGIVEVVGERDVGAPVPANVYALTDWGEVQAAELDQPTQPAELAAEIDAVRERVDDLAEQNDQLSSAVEELNEKLVLIAQHTDGVSLQ